MPELVCYGGKGGVGKTTCAAAAGLAYARDGRQTLVVSTDPAHSLADAVDADLGGEPTTVRPGLAAVETDPESGTRRYRRLFESVADELDDAGFDLDEAAIQELFAAGGLPGGDELAALSAIGRFATDERWDVVVLDTAPTGHTLRLLDLPETVGTGVRTALSLREQVRRKADAARTMVLGPYAAMGRGDEEPVDGTELAAEMSTVADVLQDEARTSFRVVTIPEVLAVRETERLVDRLSGFGVPVDTLVVNRVLTDVDEDCERCRRRRDRHQDVVDDLRERFSSLTVVTVPDIVADLRGPEALEPLADRLGPNAA